MSRRNQDRRYFFSTCSDRLISQFVQSDSASCLKTIDEESNPVLDPSFSTPNAPSMEEICKLAVNSDAAYIEEVCI